MNKGCAGGNAKERGSESLRESEQLFRSLFEMSEEAIFVLDAEGDSVGRIIAANKAAAAMHQIEERDIIGMNVLEFVTPETLEQFPGRFSRMMKGEWINAEVEHYRKDGGVVPIEIRAGMLEICGRGYIVAFDRDITERKRAEEDLRHYRERLEKLVEERTEDFQLTLQQLKRELIIRSDTEGHLKRKIADLRLTETELRNTREQLRALVAYSEKVREEERKHIAREIHDELGQALTGLKLCLMGLSGEIGRADAAGRDALLAKTSSMSELIDKLTDDVHRIAMELRPGILDHLGLASAIEWQAGDFGERTGLLCELECDRDLVIDKEVTTALFRIFQEALTNIIRHSGATAVSVRLKHAKGLLTLEVGDNGRGITDEEISGMKSFGLLGMRERVQPFGGRVTIKGEKGGGTTVTVSVPDRI